jgi:hypothetical protein
MTVEPRVALDRFVAALTAHFDAIQTRSSSADPKVDDAYDVLADAFDVYDDALAREFGEVTPFLLIDDDEAELELDDHDEHLDDDAHDDIIEVEEITDDDEDDRLTEADLA